LRRDKGVAIVTAASYFSNSAPILSDYLRSVTVPARFLLLFFAYN
jgi:hypothetical protein